MSHCNISISGLCSAFGNALRSLRADTGRGCTFYPLYNRQGAVLRLGPDLVLSPDISTIRFCREKRGSNHMPYVNKKFNLCAQPNLWICPVCGELVEADLERTLI